MTEVQRSGKAVFLDRDGTLNRDPGYIRHPDQLELLPGVGLALKKLKSLGFELIVVTNQSGVARGLIPEGTLQKIHERLNQLLESDNVQIDDFRVCTHHPDEKCKCRKPEPQLLLDAARERGLDLKKCFMVGDRLKDLQAGRRAGCQGVLLVRTGEGQNTEPSLKSNDADFIGDALIDVATWIVDQEVSSS